MLIDIRIRKCLNVQYADMQMRSIISVFLKNQDVLVCIYKGSTYFACIDYKEIAQLISNDALFKYVENKSVHEWVKGFEVDYLHQLFTAHKEISAILIEEPNYEKSTILTASREEVSFISGGGVDFSLYMKLKQRGVASYIVNFPVYVKNVYGTSCDTNFFGLYLKDMSLKNMFEKEIKKITDLEYEDFVSKVFQESELDQTNNALGADRTIFLVGPCIVGGPYFSEMSMPSILSMFLQKSNYSYNMVTIDSRHFSNKLLEYNIFQNDIVIFIGYGLNYSDYDMTERYEKYCGVKNLCINFPLHVSRVGCELVAKAFMEEIIVPQYKISDIANDKHVLSHSEENQLPYDMEYEINLFLKRTNVPQYMRRGENGAIVMNANPFTLGHRRLAEYASSQVDMLYIFVVEEDASFFSFKERFDMVRSGTRDIKNVIVIASGNFIISEKTFCGYFTKETDKEQTIDASQDIYIFARYIAPYFCIKKRFVGDEPVDLITRQYNEQMRNILPNYGCELIEISRFQENGMVISGGMVREALQSGDGCYLKNMLPKSSLHYINNERNAYENRSVDRKRNRKLNLCMTDRLLNFVQLVRYIKDHSHIIVYGIGEYARIMMQLLNEEEKEKILFVDRQAVDSEISFMGKKVLAPKELMYKYLEYKIVILSPRYYKEIYFECIDMGLDRERIIYNAYDLYSKVKTG